ncbi:MAG TPA: hypothetical protein VN372_04800 [Methanospirillum sp.]|nr:hypothetical protein [Methanospirillum sp.]
MITTISDPRVIDLDKTVSDKMIRILVDDVYSVTTSAQEDIYQDAHSSHESHQDIFGVIRKRKKTARGKNKSTFMIWPDIKTMIEGWRRIYFETKSSIFHRSMLSVLQIS